jgi:chloride channel 3/4/5
VDIDGLLREHDFHGFPVVKEREFVGYVTRDRLEATIGKKEHFISLIALA